MAGQIRDYVKRARREPSTENLEALWRAVFLLKGWYFLPAAEREGPNHPAVMVVEGEPWLVAFTNVRRLEEFARGLGRVDDDETLHLLVLDPLESMQKILEVRDSIHGVVFNPDSPSTFRAPVDALEGYADHFDVPLDQS
ncbi:MAG: SseB family protein [Persicimonas sp.]